MSAITSGRFEVPQDSFDDITAEASSAVHRIDLKELLPDLFVGTDRMPRLLAGIWRVAVDEAMDKSKGAYTLRGGNIVELMFDSLPDGAAKVKIDAIRSSIIARVREQQAPPVLEFTEAETKKPPSKETTLKALTEKMETSFSKMVREGLGDNPGDDMVRLWAARTMHNMIHSHHKIPLLPEMMTLVEQSDIAYAPLLDSETGAIAGASSVIKSPVPVASYNTGEIMRQDLAMLFSAAVQLYYMQSKGQSGVIMLPVRAATLSDDALADLYRSFLPRLSPQVAGSLMLEVQGLPQDGYFPALTETINGLSNAVRSCVFQTSVLVRQDPLPRFPVLHACGFTLKEEGVPRQTFSGQGKIYAIYYRNLGIKTYIKDVSDEDALAFARENGFTYITGTALGPLQKSAGPQQKARIV